MDSPPEMRFAHLSDWHATTLVGGGSALLGLKRLSGWASWRISRRQHHSPTILEAAFRDLHRQGINRILVTGDLTHVSLEQEFRVAAEQLARLGTPEEVFLIPGNHDCYVPVSHERSWDHWCAYLTGMSPDELGADSGSYLTPPRSPQLAPRHEDYPTLRVEGGLAMIGLCSAIPTPIFRAGGRLGRGQLERLENLLTLLRERQLFRVVMVHHPIAATSESSRRALSDAEDLRRVLERVGAELVLHGHKHRRRIAMLKGPSGEIPVIGVPSTSEIGSRPDRRAQYHVYAVRPADSRSGFQIEADIRGFNSKTGEFESVDERLTF